MSTKIFAAMIATVCGVSSAVYAVEAIPKEGGFSGYLNVGVTSTQIESNTLAKVASTEISEQKIDSLNNSPDSKSAGLPAIGGQVAYTFADTRTQIYFGTRLEDFLTMDSTVGLGVRQEVAGFGTFGVAALKSSPVGLDVYSDPYAVGVDRKSTQKTNDGFRISAEKLFDTGLELTYTIRRINLDNELSGTAPVLINGTSTQLTAAQQDLLNREGDVKKIEIAYAFTELKDHIIVPTVYALNQDLDGKAMGGDGWGAKLNWAYKFSDTLRFVTNFDWSSMEADKVNPIFNQKSKADSIGVSVAGFYKEPFGLKGWQGNLTAAYGEDDNDIDFYSSKTTLVTLGMLYSFR